MSRFLSIHIMSMGKDNKWKLWHRLLNLEPSIFLECLIQKIYWWNEQKFWHKLRKMAGKMVHIKFNQEDSMKKILVPATDGTQIPLSQVADINYVRGPQVGKSEDTFLTAYVLFDMKPGEAEVNVVEDAQRYLNERIDSGEFVELSKYARKHFRDTGVNFLKIFVSSGLDEYSIADMINAGAQIDGIGIGTRFAVSQNAPSLNIVYKLIEYAGKDIHKSSPNKKTIPGRKSILRKQDTFFINDTVLPYTDRPDDLIKPFDSPQNIDSIKNRLTKQLKKERPA